MGRARRSTQQSKAKLGPIPDPARTSPPPAVGTRREARAARRREAPRRAPAAEQAPLAPFRLTVAVALIGALLVVVPALFYRLGDLPIVLWDESRVATSALEMARAGFTIAPTYNGVVDMTYVKPPLTIWMEAVGILVLGANELAVRLPSVLSALGTGLVLFGLIGGFLRRPAAGFVAVAVLFSSAGYLDFHAARAGDIDASMAFLTFGWLVAAFLYFEDVPERRRLWLAVCAAALAFDFLDKSIQGLIPLPSIFIYAAWRGRLRETLRSRSVWAAAGAVTAVIVGYFAIREAVNPGYAAAAIGRDILDRTHSVIEGHQGPISFYVDYSLSGLIGFLKPTGAFPLLVPSIIATALLGSLGSPRVRPIAGFLALAMVVTLSVLSIMTTKVAWYALPLYPLAAAGVGVTVIALADWLVGIWPRGRRAIDAGFVVAGLATIVLVVTMNARSVDDRIAWYLADEQYATAAFLAGPVARSGQTGYVIAIDPGFMPAAFYARALAPDNRPAPLVSPTGPLPDGTQKVVSCGSATAQVTAYGYRMTPLVTSGNCGLYAIVPGAAP